MALPDLLTPEQVAKHLGCSYGAVLRAIRSGELRAKKIGKGYLMTEAAVAAFISPTEPAPQSPPRVAGRVTRPGRRRAAAA